MNPYNTRSQGEPSPGLGRGRGAPTPSPDRPARSRSLSPVGRSTPPTAGASPSAHLPHSAAAPTSELPAASAAGASGLETTSASQAPSTSGVANNLPGAAAGTAAQQSTLERSIFDLSQHGALSTPGAMQEATDLVLQATAGLARGPFPFGSPTLGPTPTGTASSLQQTPSLNLQSSASLLQGNFAFPPGNPLPPPTGPSQVVSAACTHGASATYYPYLAAPLQPPGSYGAMSAAAPANMFIPATYAAPPSIPPGPPAGPPATAYPGYPQQPSFLSNVSPAIRQFNDPARAILNQPTLGYNLIGAPPAYDLLKCPAHFAPNWQHDTTTPTPMFVDPSTHQPYIMAASKALLTRLPASAGALAALFDNKPFLFMVALGQATEALLAITQDQAEAAMIAAHTDRVQRAVSNFDGRDHEATWARLALADQCIRRLCWQYGYSYGHPVVAQDPEMQDSIAACQAPPEVFARRHPGSVLPHGFRGKAPSGQGRGGSNGGEGGTRRSSVAAPKPDAPDYIKGKDCPFYFHNGPGRCKWADTCKFQAGHHCVYCLGDHASVACPTKAADPSLKRQ